MREVGACRVGPCVLLPPRRSVRVRGVRGLNFKRQRRSPPEEHHSPLDLRGQSDMKLLEEYTGRTYKASKYWAEFSPTDAEVFFQVRLPPPCAVLSHDLLLQIASNSR